MPSAQLANKPVDLATRAMIDRYIADGGVVKIIPPSAAQLRPTRHRLDWASIGAGADAASVLRAVRTTKTRAPAAYENWPPMEAVVTTVGPCPSAPGSSRHKRYEILRPGLTLGELRQRGLRLSDLTRYLGSAAVQIAIPTSDAGGAE